MKTLAALTIAMAFSSSLAAAQQGDQEVSESRRAAIEKAVLETNMQMVRAAQALDVDRLFSYMLDTDKGCVIQNGQLLLTRADAQTRNRNAFQGLRKVDYGWKQQHVTVLSPTVALLVAEGESSVTTEQGATFNAPFAQTVVFVLKDGQWKALHAHQSSPPRR
jgi:hypothetical protein